MTDFMFRMMDAGTDEEDMVCCFTVTTKLEQSVFERYLSDSSDGGAGGADFRAI